MLGFVAARKRLTNIYNESPKTYRERAASAPFKSRTDSTEECAFCSEKRQKLAKHKWKIRAWRSPA
jgi:hypothetical protein